MSETNHLDLWPLVGFVVKAHGVRGQVCIQLFNSNSTCLEQATSIKIDEQLYEISDIRPAKNQYILNLADICDRDRAEKLKGASVFMSRSELGLREGEVLLSDLVGMDVVDIENKQLGVVKSVETGPQDRLVVVTVDEEFQIPLVEQLVPEIKLEQRQIVVNLPEGLPRTKRLDSK